MGLGFRLGLADELLASETSRATFLEVCPENYVGVGGRRRRLLDAARERWPILCHGLCGDLAGQAPLELELLKQVRDFLRSVGAEWYSDHLCWTHLGGGELHELVVMPYTAESVERTAARIRQVREILEMPMAVENVSAYGVMPGASLSEPEFVRAVAEEADCHLLLDVNNVYVNSVNFKFDPRDYIAQLPLERVIQLHMAGHDVEEDDLLLDTHSMPIDDPVYDLFAYTVEKMNHRVPVLLERDGNFPPLAELEAELARMEAILEGSDG